MNATDDFTPEPGRSSLTLVLGGTRSGKSELAEGIAARCGSRIVYVATAEVLSGAGSMQERVRRHRERRPADWATLEFPSHVAASVRQSGALAGADAVMLDCVTLLASNTLYAGDPEDGAAFETRLREEIDGLTELAASSGLPWIVVSSEAGLGIVSGSRETRLFCDGLGLANQWLAKKAEAVFLSVAGLPLRLK